MGTIKCGFWTTKFIITPNEFGEFLQLCDKYKFEFFVPSYGNPQNTISEVFQKYEMFYEKYTVADKPDKVFHSLAYSMVVEFEKYKSGFQLLLDDIHFYKNNVLSRDKIPYLRISYPKGYAVNYEDERGKYFVYEDINKYEPEMYPIFETLSKHLKQFTKPFRFEILQKDKIEEQTPSSVRISQQAAQDFAKSWLFEEYELKMKSFEL